MADKLRIGIYGGAFNPIHNGHLHLLDTLYRAQTPFGGLDKLLIVPTANPPHKSAGDLIPATHRIAMIRLAVESLPCADKIEISTIELESRGKSYTYTTLVKLKEIYPNGEFVLFIGSDQLFDFQKWYRYQDILKLAQVRAITRQECQRQAVADFLTRNKDLAGISVLVAKPVVVSSTQIRQRVAQGERIVEILKQDRNSPIPVEKQVAILYATVHGYLKDIAVKDIAAYESALYQYLDENVTAGGVMEAIRTTGDMKQDTEQQMKDVLAAFTADFIKNAG